MSMLENERAELQRRVDDLRGFEREYRSRLRSYLYGLLGGLERPDALCHRHGWENCEDVTCLAIAGAVAAERERIAALAERVGASYFIEQVCDTEECPDVTDVYGFADLIRGVTEPPAARKIQGG